jgi:hypothetical protein
LETDSTDAANEKKGLPADANQQQPPYTQMPAPYPGMIQTTGSLRSGQIIPPAVPLNTLFDEAAPVECPACGHRVVTRIGYEAGGLTW